MRFEIIGSMRLFCIDKKTRRPLPRMITKHGVFGDTGWEKNMIVETGKEFILDEICNNGKWNAAAGIVAGAVGTSTATNAGVAGPSESVPSIPVGGAWDGVSEDDWRLSAEMTRAAIIEKTRTDQTVELIAQIDESDLVFVDGICKIREAGVFLHATTPPSANPQDVPAQKPYGMVARRVYYGLDDPEDPQNYVERPFYKVEDGTPLMFKYMLELG